MAHVGSVLSGREGEMNHSMIFDFLLKCLGHSHIEPDVEKGSFHFNGQSYLL